MNSVKEIIVYSKGNSNDLKTWSNVPYFLTHALEEKNIIVDRVNIDIEENATLLTKLVSISYKILNKILRIIFKQKAIAVKFTNSNYYNKRVEKIIDDARIKYPNYDAELMISLSFAKKSNKTFVMFGDWTVEYKIKNNQNRLPYFFEKCIINRQNNAISKADYVISIMKSSTDFINNIFVGKALYFGYYINSLVKFNERTIVNKYKSKHILFIGRAEVYLSGLIDLINVVNMYNKKYKDNLEIDVVAMNKNDISSKIETSICNFYGYLDKGKIEEEKLYNSLISNAKLVSNLTKNYNGMSSLLESLYLGTPIVVSKTYELSNIIGIKSTNYCIYCDNIEDTVKNIKKMMDLDFEEYSSCCIQANSFAKQFHWNNYIDKIINVINMEK